MIVMLLFDGTVTILSLRQQQQQVDLFHINFNIEFHICSHRLDLSHSQTSESSLFTYGYSSHYFSEF